MQKIILTKEQIREFISENAYKITNETKFLSRCVDGRYQKIENLPPLALPGADLGGIGSNCCDGQQLRLWD